MASDIKGGYWLARQATIFPSTQIPVSYFTHLFYAFVAVDADTGRLIIPDEESTTIQGFMETIHKGNRKAVLSIGGPKLNGADVDPSDAISTIASDPDKRATFISSTIENAHKYSFSGLDLAWEFPRNNEDMSNLGVLFHDWHEQIENRSAHLLLAASVYFAATIRRGNQIITYPAVAINNYVDFVNVILYDYSPATAAPAQFYNNQHHNKSGSEGLRSWIRAGVPAKKLRLGIPLYGKQWTLADEDDNGIGAPVVAYNGDVPYSQIPGAIHGTYDGSTLSEYLSDGTSWFGYDGTTSINEKIQRARRDDLIGGYFLYPLGDDSHHTLSQAASNAWDH